MHGVSHSPHAILTLLSLFEINKERIARGWYTARDHQQRLPLNGSRHDVRDNHHTLIGWLTDWIVWHIDRLIDGFIGLFIWSDWSIIWLIGWLVTNSRVAKRADWGWRIDWRIERSIIDWFITAIDWSMCRVWPSQHAILTLLNSCERKKARIACLGFHVLATKQASYIDWLIVVDWLKKRTLLDWLIGLFDELVQRWTLNWIGGLWFSDNTGVVIDWLIEINNQTWHSDNPSTNL